MPLGSLLQGSVSLGFFLSSSGHPFYRFLNVKRGFSVSLKCAKTSRLERQITRGTGGLLAPMWCHEEPMDKPTGRLHVTAVSRHWQELPPAACVSGAAELAEGEMLNLLRPDGMQPLFPLQEPDGPGVDPGELLA